MKIKREVYEYLLGCPQVPPEVGGILGGENGIIKYAIIDIGEKACTNIIQYVPDVSFINHQISIWNSNGIDFCGIFHTHSKKWPTLSLEDKNYIKTIMKAMPEHVEKLYFPLVFPGNKVTGFVAEKKYETIYITEQKIKII